MSLRWSQRVLKTSMGGPVCRPCGLKRFPHGGRPQGPPLRRIQKLSLRFVGAGHWPARRGGAAIPGPTLIRLACARYLSPSPLSLRDIIPTPLGLRLFPPDRGNRPLDKESRPLLYGFQESLPGLGRGGPWASRRDLHRERWLGKARRSSRTATILNFANPGPGGPEGIADRHSDFSRRKFSV